MIPADKMGLVATLHHDSGHRDGHPDDRFHYGGLHKVNEQYHISGLIVFFLACAAIVQSYSVFYQ